jgi:membrane-associated phospholipid phosphatase
VTYILVISGFDWKYLQYIQSTHVAPYLSSAMAVGALIPIIGLPCLYVYSKVARSKILLSVTWALSQAALLGLVISSFYKALTGRVQPPHALASSLIDTSREWNFGILKHGVFWGWPSSHTAVAFAMAVALGTLYPRQKWVLYVGLLYAFYIGIGVSTRIHWFSEFAAGAIIGSVVGVAVGTTFKSQAQEIK